jgi:hypothetical protein
MLNYAATSLTSYAYIKGWVLGAETEAGIPATVTITQLGNTEITNTISSTGEYNTSLAIITGGVVTMNVSAIGYRSQDYNFTPMVARTIVRNWTMVPTTPTCGGVCIGGVVSDNVYGNPVDSATVVVQNGTTSTTLTNRAGYYRVDSLVDGTLYDVWSSKPGYGNSTVAQNLAVGT